MSGDDFHLSPGPKRRIDGVWLTQEKHNQIQEDIAELRQENAEQTKVWAEVRRYLKTLNRSEANRLITGIEATMSEEDKRWINLGF